MSDIQIYYILGLPRILLLLLLGGDEVVAISSGVSSLEGEEVEDSGFEVTSVEGRSNPGIATCAVPALASGASSFGVSTMDEVTSFGAVAIAGVSSFGVVTTGAVSTFGVVLSAGVAGVAVVAV